MTRNNAEFQNGYGGVGEPTIQYIPHEDKYGNLMHAFQMRDSVGNLLGNLHLNEYGTISAIETHPQLRRHGIATALYNHAKEASQKDPSIPAPVHSSSRTTAGTAWARSIAKSEGGPLKELHHKVSPQTYAMTAGSWEMMLPLRKTND